MIFICIHCTCMPLCFSLVFPVHWISDATKIPKAIAPVRQRQLQQTSAWLFRKPRRWPWRETGTKSLRVPFQWKDSLILNFQSGFLFSMMQICSFYLYTKKNRTSRTSLWVSIEPYGTSPNWSDHQKRASNLESCWDAFRVGDSQRSVKWTPRFSDDKSPFPLVSTPIIAHGALC